MPTIEVKTTKSDKVWTAPDGKMSIYELELEYDGQPVKAKTYSESIATIGWSGTVESYEKSGRNGTETFVKQPKKEGYSGGGGGYSKGVGGRPPADPFTMYLSYAKDIAVAMYNKDGTIKPDELKQVITMVLAGGHELYDGRPDAAQAPKEQASEKTEPVSDAELKSLADKVGGEVVDLGEVAP
jgi:hypothetical protein